MTDTPRSPLITHAHVSTNVTIDKQELAERLVHFVTEKFGKSPYIDVASDQAGLLALTVDYEKLAYGIEDAYVNKIAQSLRDIPGDMVPLQDIYVEGKGQSTTVHFSLDKTALLNVLGNANIQVQSSDTSPIPETMQEIVQRAGKIVHYQSALNQLTIDADSLVAVLRGYASQQAKAGQLSAESIKELWNDPIRFDSMMKEILPEGILMQSKQEGKYDLSVPVSTLMGMANKASQALPNGVLNVHSTGEGKDVIRIDVRHAVDYVSSIAEQTIAAQSKGSVGITQTDRSINIAYQNYGMAESVEKILSDLASATVKILENPTSVVSGGGEHKGNGPEKGSPGQAI